MPMLMCHISKECACLPPSSAVLISQVTTEYSCSYRLSQIHWVSPYGLQSQWYPATLHTHHNKHSHCKGCELTGLQYSCTLALYSILEQPSIALTVCSVNSLWECGLRISVSQPWPQHHQESPADHTHTPHNWDTASSLAYGGGGGREAWVVESNVFLTWNWKSGETTLLY